MKQSNLKRYGQLIGFSTLLSLLFLMSCAPTRVETKYYLIDYSPDTGDRNFKIDKPFPYRTLVSTFKIPRSFD